MRPTPAYWCAIRLISFANLNITEANWRSLWKGCEYGIVVTPDEWTRLTNGGPRHVAGAPGGAREEWREWVHMLRLLDLSVRERQERLGALGLKDDERFGWAMRETDRSARRQRPASDNLAAPRVGELWKAFVDDVYDLAKPFLFAGADPSHPTLALGALATQLPRYNRGRIRRSGIVPMMHDVQVLWEELPIRPWPRRGKRHPRVSFVELEQCQAFTREWLRAISANEDLATLVGVLERYRPPHYVLRAYAMGPMTALRTGFWYDMQRHSGPLNTHVDGLFVRTAVGEMWKRFFQCAADCGRFGIFLRGHVSHEGGEDLSTGAVLRSPKPRHFCSDACKVRENRRDKARKRTAKARALKRFYYEEFRDLRPPEKRLERAARQVGLSVQEASSLLERMS